MDGGSAVRGPESGTVTAFWAIFAVRGTENGTVTAFRREEGRQGCPAKPLVGETVQKLARLPKKLAKIGEMVQKLARLPRQGGSRRNNCRLPSKSAQNDGGRLKSCRLGSPQEWKGDRAARQCEGQGRRGPEQGGAATGAGGQRRGTVGQGGQRRRSKGMSGGCPWRCGRLWGKAFLAPGLPVPGHQGRGYSWW